MKLFFILWIIGSSLVASAQTAAPSPIKIFGFIKAGTVMSTSGVESFGRPDAVAYTAAGNPALSLHRNRASQSFQVQQSRFGILAPVSEDVAGTLEFDFVDFSKSTPTTASVIRLRRAFVTFKNEDWTFNVGQDWDLFSPLAPHSYNYIGHYFGSGDLGFMRIQGQALKKSGNWEHAIAVGFPGNNNGLSQGTLEYSFAPTLALRETWKDSGWTLGASGIVGHLEDSATDRTLTPYGLNLFGKKTMENFEVTSEVYFGQNLENMSMLALGYSPTFKKLNEFGGYVTMKYKSNRHGFFGGLGHSRILSASNLTPSYGYVGGKPVLNLTGTSTGYGILQNSTARLGYDYSWSPQLNFFFETAFLLTRHKLDPADDARLPQWVNSQVFELGLKLDI